VKQSWTFADVVRVKLDIFGCCCPKVWLSQRGPKTSRFPLRSALSSLQKKEKKMELDWKVCSRARLSRDPRFDGKFFIAVRGSGVYCRPICPSPTANEKNVRYFPTAAAAAEAGFRPCLRCRPECSPGTPAWIGTPNTVSRALRLIGESGLDGGVEALAQHLGVGSRHLRRLFIRHLGASPNAVAQTRRLHFAKKLIDETMLSMHEVAIASGFGCVRRFNAAIRGMYKRTPTQIRRLSRQTGSLPENQYLFRLRFRPPYDWAGMLDFLKPRATPGAEEVVDNVYRRSISFRGTSGYFEVSYEPSHNSLVAKVQFGEPRALFFIIERIRAMFDLNADWSAIAQVLRTDPLLAERVKANPGLRVPGCWNGFELGVRAILGQQITVKGATGLAGKLASRFGQQLSSANGLTCVFPEPEVLAEADIASIGMPQARVRTIQAFARSVRNNEISFEGIIDSEVFLDRLCSIAGIGKWTAQYVAMRALRDPDAFPSGDLGLLRALSLESSRELELRAKVWQPWRAYAAMYLWSRPIEGRTRRSKLHSPQGKTAPGDLVSQPEATAAM
jgi:AraC family transcriptional regulator of adaptative response / DNA-3-methyladenine glycosylase II